MRLVSAAVMSALFLAVAPSVGAEPPTPKATAASKAEAIAVTPPVDTQLLQIALLQRQVDLLEDRLDKLEQKNETLEKFATGKALALLNAELELKKLVDKNAELATKLAALTTEYRGHTHNYAKTKVDYGNASCEDCSSAIPQFGGMVSFIYGLTSVYMTTDAPTAH